MKRCVRARGLRFFGGGGGARARCQACRPTPRHRPPARGGDHVCSHGQAIGAIATEPRDFGGVFPQRARLQWTEQYDSAPNFPVFCVITRLSERLGVRVAVSRFGRNAVRQTTNKDDNTELRGAFPAGRRARLGWASGRALYRMSISLQPQRVSL